MPVVGRNLVVTGCHRSAAEEKVVKHDVALGFAEIGNRLVYAGEFLLAVLRLSDDFQWDFNFHTGLCRAVERDSKLDRSAGIDCRITTLYTRWFINIWPPNLSTLSERLETASMFDRKKVNINPAERPEVSNATGTNRARVSGLTALVRATLGNVDSRTESERLAINRSGPGSTFAPWLFDWS